MTAVESLIWMVLTLFFEARNQPIEGQVAICHVVLNRAEQRGTSPLEEIQRPFQFSWTIDGIQLDELMNDPESLEKAIRASTQCLKERVEGKTFGLSTHYYNPKQASPGWRKNMVVVKRIKDHIFLKKPKKGG